MPFVPSFLAGLSAKAAAGLAVAAIAIGGGATVATVATHSVSPAVWVQAVWGHQVTKQVAICKKEYGPNATTSGSTTGSTTPKENIGQCVSAFAKTHGQGQAQRQLHAAGKGANANAHAGGRPNGVTGGASTGQHGRSSAPKSAGKPKGNSHSTSSGH